MYNCAAKVGTRTRSIHIYMYVPHFYGWPREGALWNIVKLNWAWYYPPVDHLGQSKVYKMLRTRLSFKNSLRHFAHSSLTFYIREKSVKFFLDFSTPVAIKSPFLKWAKHIANLQHKSYVLPKFGTFRCTECCSPADMFASYVGL